MRSSAPIRQDEVQSALPAAGRQLPGKALAVREAQEQNRRVCGNCYSKKYDGYVFVDASGHSGATRKRYNANFSKLLEQNGLRHIRFHDLQT